LNSIPDECAIAFGLTELGEDLMWFFAEKLQPALGELLGASLLDLSRFACWNVPAGRVPDFAYESAH